ncbi:MAG TPA: rod shape-determining protein RodA [Gemmatimonadales bacterium]|jgi:rod shape determining protein RodA|nr:rod shape-determining protein RodA [Gemmatimonadales bacterium]
MRGLTIDRTLVITLLLLIIFGVLNLYSAGQTDVPTQAIGVWKRQLVWLVIGGIACYVMFRTSPRLLEWAAPWVYAFALLLLAVTLVIGTGQGTAASTRSWISIGGHQLGQPAELAKVAVVLMLARYLSSRREAPISMRELIVPCLIAGIPFLLVLKQPDLGSALVFIGILFAMLFWAGVRPYLLILLASPVVSLLAAFTTWSWVAWMVLLTVLLLIWRPFVFEAVFIWMVNAVMGFIAMPLWNRLAPYQQNRLLTFLNPEIDPQAAGYHAIQSKVAIGSGGLMGNGWLEGPQKRLAFLPTPSTDFAFTVVGEELGFIGVTIALVLFLVVFMTMVRIARRASDPFSSLLVFGILGMLFTHVWENVGMTVNIMPITGIPLPFFSYGGSFLLACALGLGMVLRVAWDSRMSGYIEA